MSLTLTTATTQVRENLNEANASFWSDTEIQNWIKEGVQMFSSVTLMIEDTQNITLVTSQLTYTSSDAAFIANVIEPYALIYDDGSNNYKGLIKAHPRMIGHIDTFTAGSPKYYMFHNRRFYIWPLPTSDENGNTISCLHSKVTNDITAMEDEYQVWPVIYATAKGKQKDKMSGEAGALFSQFYSMINFERQDKHAREIDSMDKFLIPAHGGGTEAQSG